MSEQSATLEATSTPEVVIMEASRGPLVNLTVEQRKEFRTTGTLPKAESAPATSVSGESEAPKQQEKPKSEPKPKKDQTAEERIAQLESTIERIKAGAGLTKPKAEITAPAKSEPAAQSSKRPTAEDKKPNGSDKFQTFEELEEAVLDWKLEQRDIAKAEKDRQTKVEAQAEATGKELNAKLEEARTRYENLDEVILPAANEIWDDKGIAQFVKDMFGDSDVFVDLLYTISSDKAEYAKFLDLARTNPRKAARFISLTESLIAQELEAKATPAKEEAPAKPRTLAPKPPAETGGRASAPPDSMQAALAGSGGKLTGDLKAEFNRQALARMK